MNYTDDYQLRDFVKGVKNGMNVKGLTELDLDAKELKNGRQRRGKRQ